MPCQFSPFRTNLEVKKKYKIHSFPVPTRQNVLAAVKRSRIFPYSPYLHGILFVQTQFLHGKCTFRGIGGLLIWGTHSAPIRGQILKIFHVRQSSETSALPKSVLLPESADFFTPSEV